VVQKTDTQFYFLDNFGNSAPILTILSLLQAEMARKPHLYCVITLPSKTIVFWTTL